MNKTFIGTTLDILDKLSCKFNKRLYLGQIFKIENEKYLVTYLQKLDDGRIVVYLQKKGE